MCKKTRVAACCCVVFVLPHVWSRTVVWLSYGVKTVGGYYSLSCLDRGWIENSIEF